MEISIGHRNSYIPGVASRLSVCVNAPDRLSQWLPFSALIIYCVCQLPITGSLITFSTLCLWISLSDFVAHQVLVKLVQCLIYCYAFDVNTYAWLSVFMIQNGRYLFSKQVEGTLFESIVLGTWSP